MNIKIVTFHFANNYGAVLQAYALRMYMSQYGNTEFLNYEPKHLKRMYTLNPFCCGFHPREVVRRIKSISYKKKQFGIFAEFRKNELNCNKKDLCNKKKIGDSLNKSDVVVYGSDQIWNLNITHSDGIYFGEGVDNGIKKIAYAASFGVGNDYNTLNQYIEQYLKSFNAISVREQNGIEILKEKGIGFAEMVCDPVFLLSREKWEEIATKPVENIPTKYILYYALRRDNSLISTTKKISREFGIPVLSIHPNGDKFFMIENELYEVGPKEFVWLVKNAEYVCTNSFHAVAFSTIFAKKVVFISYETGRGRVESLLSILMSPDLCTKDENGNMIFDLSRADLKKLNLLKEQSRIFLKRSFMDDADISNLVRRSKSN